ncbi:type IV toxin-antitoxin system AbiEi family antitoxin [Granulosicoccus antarcticus]|uniref:Restriction endonuclease type IV Mrr domain-containing protein n=1 Tax=Granulosicoccus antarcticus IMCC3135 TaxID=1192854 RepID=A0A2Z2NVH2_9GAMM|nr:type IV toxin-antitoxin system AbiEi family antitoxin [Granulosicoccus antarcticus]ASJ72790.1 hypothetical protein IMCC3135_13525 [Granulosicoccus antarcticus IMCC3135]
MDKSQSELDILKLAIEALNSNAGLEAEILDTTTLPGKTTARIPDAELRLLETGEKYRVEVKRHAQNVNLGSLINQIKRLPGPEPGLLAADYINPRMAEKLKEAGVQFIDTCGNAYINQQPVYVLITGKKQLKLSDNSVPSQINRAFEPKGLLVTYAFLEDPSLVAKSYREIARVSAVAVGTVGWVINALKAGHYLGIDASTGRRRITNYEKLLDRWVSAWPEKLKHKHSLGKFTAKDPHWWKHTNIQMYEGYWGGETAAAIYTNHLKPQVATVYIPKHNLAKLIRDSRLSKAREQGQDNDVLVYLYSPFWNTSAQRSLARDNNQELPKETTEPLLENAETAVGLANPIIVYADLIATGDPRNLETAQRLRDEYITEPDRAT